MVDDDAQRIVRLTLTREAGVAGRGAGPVRTLTPLVVGLMRAL